MSFSARQNLMVRAFLAIAAKVGPWSKGHDSEGACYTGEASNVSKASGFICRNCAFWRAPDGCSIVKGKIEPQGICRLHVIPQERLTQRARTPLRGRISGETF